MDYFLKSMQSVQVEINTVYSIVKVESMVLGLNQLKTTDHHFITELYIYGNISNCNVSEKY